MTTSSSSSNTIRFVSTFLSHSSGDKRLVEEVAVKLGRRGVLAWLEELAPGPLDTALKEAVRRQATLTIFLSESYLKSDWCMDELRWALEGADSFEHLLPVYLGDPVQLVKRHSLLNKRFLHADGNRVKQLGFHDKNDPVNPDPSAVAAKIAEAAYRRSIPEACPDIAIVLDQRGDGPRRGQPALPPNIASLDIPVLTFRPNLGPRGKQELLRGPEWQEVSANLELALSNALGTLRGDPRAVRVLGNAQCGLVWVVGRHFNRTTSSTLYGYDKEGTPVTNRNQIRHVPLPDGNREGAELLPGVPVQDQPVVALGVGPAKIYADRVRKAVPNLPLFWIESGFITDSEQAMQLVKDLVASVSRLDQDHGVREALLFWTTANHVALLAAANLTSHLSPRIRFMEWDHANGEYVELPMP